MATSQETQIIRTVGQVVIKGNPNDACMKSAVFLESRVFCKCRTDRIRKLAHYVRHVFLMNGKGVSMSFNLKPLCAAAALAAALMPLPTAAGKLMFLST